MASLESPVKLYAVGLDAKIIRILTKLKKENKINSKLDYSEKW